MNLNRRHSVFNRTISWLLLVVFLVLTFNPAFAEYSVSRRYDKDTAADFDYFLNNCTREERVQLLQSLRELPKLKDSYFGQLSGLPNLEFFAKDKKEASARKPLKPKTFNEVPVDAVISAVDRNILKEDDISALTIKKALIYRANNKLTYWFRGNEVDYHKLVQWAAKQHGIENTQVNALPTFDLERKIAERYWEKKWNKLTPEQRLELLKHVEREVGKITNKAGIATMSGAAALATLNVAVVAMGFKFYILMSSTIYFVAGLFGVTLPFAVYSTASTVACILSGPIGWVIGAVAAATGAVALGWPEKDTVGAFIMTANAIKTSNWGVE